MSLPYMSKPSGAELVKEAQRKAKEEGFVFWPDVTAEIDAREKARAKLIKKYPNKDYIKITDGDLPHALYNSPTIKRIDRCSDDCGWMIDIVGFSIEGVFLAVCVILPDHGPLEFMSCAPLPEPDKD